MANIYAMIQSMCRADETSLPLFPDLTRQNFAHDVPVPSSARLVPLGHLARVVLGKNIRAFIIEEDLLLDLVLGQQQVSANLAVEEVTGAGTAELDIPRSLATEDDHVGEVASPLLDVLLVTGVLTEGPARGKNLLNGAIDERGSRKTKVTSVVLKGQVNGWT